MPLENCFLLLLCVGGGNGPVKAGTMVNKTIRGNTVISI